MHTVVGVAKGVVAGDASVAEYPSVTVGPIEIFVVGSWPWDFYAIEEMRRVVVATRYVASVVEDYMKESLEQRLPVGAFASTTVVATENSAS